RIRYEDSRFAWVTSSFARPAPALRDESELVLLDLDGGARSLELGLDVGRFVLADVLDDGAARFDQVLGFLEPEAGDGAHLLDDLELLVARCGDDDRELGLLFRWGGLGRGGPRHHGAHRHRCRGFHTPRLLESVYQ